MLAKGAVFMFGGRGMAICKSECSTYGTFSQEYIVSNTYVCFGEQFFVPERGE